MQQTKNTNMTTNILYRAGTRQRHIIDDNKNLRKSGTCGLKQEFSRGSNDN